MVFHPFQIPIRMKKLVPIPCYWSAVVMLILCATCSSTAPEPEEWSPEILLDWNEAIFDIAVSEDGLSTLKGLRTAAMLHTAIHDALNTIRPRYQRYAYQDMMGEPLDPLAAVTEAAYQISTSQYPNQRKQFDALRIKWLAEVPPGPMREGALALGEASARAILQARADDAWNGEAEYTWHPMAPGVYAEFSEHSGTPEGFVFGAGWALAHPFLLEGPDQFRAPPPPEINSEAYTIAFNEVKSLGHTYSSERTGDQAHLAMWWKDFVENSHNRLTRQLVQGESLNLWAAARVFALLNMTIFDAYVCVFDDKFHYNHWRPYTAIRWAANDKNPDTAPDTTWNNLHRNTYAFPSYPSAHGTASSAAMTVLATTLGTGDDYAFTMSTDSVDRAGLFSEKMAMDPPTRSFTSFSEAGMEAAMSRVYLGIHFRYDSEAGFELGQKIGEYVGTKFLQPIQ